MLRAPLLVALPILVALLLAAAMGTRPEFEPVSADKPVKADEPERGVPAQVTHYLGDAVDKVTQANGDSIQPAQETPAVPAEVRPHEQETAEQEEAEQAKAEQAKAEQEKAGSSEVKEYLYQDADDAGAAASIEGNGDGSGGGDLGCTSADPQAVGDGDASVASGLAETYVPFACVICTAWKYVFESRYFFCPEDAKMGRLPAASKEVMRNCTKTGNLLTTLDESDFAKLAIIRRCFPPADISRQWNTDASKVIVPPFCAILGHGRKFFAEEPDRSEKCCSRPNSFAHPIPPDIKYEKVSAQSIIWREDKDYTSCYSGVAYVGKTNSDYYLYWWEDKVWEKYPTRWSEDNKLKKFSASKREVRLSKSSEP